MCLGYEDPLAVQITMEEGQTTIDVPADSPLPVPQTGQERSSANNTPQANRNNERPVIVPVWNRVLLDEPSQENRTRFYGRLMVDFIIVAILVYSLYWLFKW